MSGREGRELAQAVEAGAELTEAEQLRVVLAVKDAQVGRLVARNTDALGFIDQTAYANDDSRDDLKWSNAEVLELLGMIRDKITADMVRCDYCGDELPSVQSREHIPTTPDLQRLGFSVDKVVCPECVSDARAQDEAVVQILVGDAVPEPTPTTPQITEAMVERMARALFARTTEGRNGFSWPLNGDWDRKRDLDDARRALVHVLGSS